MPRRRDEPVRLTRIYTRGGDAGETSLGDGSRVSKLDPLIRGVRRRRRAQLADRVGAGRCVPTLASSRVQNELFDLGADLSVPFAAGDGRLRITQAAIDRLEADCDEANASAAGASSPSCCRAAARVPRGCTSRAPFAGAPRASCVWAATERPVNPLVPVYLNRLSDLLFILARAANAGGDEPLWLPGGDR